MRASAANSKRIISALKKFGAPLFSISEDYFSVEGNFFQIGAPPLRIDLITKIDAVTFDEAIATAVPVGKSPQNFHILSLDNLIKNKEATHRDKDKPDALELRKLRNKSQAPKG